MISKAISPQRIHRKLLEQFKRAKNYDEQLFSPVSTASSSSVRKALFADIKQTSQLLLDNQKSALNSISEVATFKKILAEVTKHIERMPKNKRYVVNFFKQNIEERITLAHKQKYAQEKQNRETTI